MQTKECKGKHAKEGMRRKECKDKNAKERTRRKACKGKNVKGGRHVKEKRKDERNVKVGRTEGTNETKGGSEKGM
jgi:hypothetical protein